MVVLVALGKPRQAPLPDAPDAHILPPVVLPHDRRLALPLARGRLRRVAEDDRLADAEGEVDGSGGRGVCLSSLRSSVNRGRGRE